jgi:hypothetical protein
MLGWLAGRTAAAVWLLAITAVALVVAWGVVNIGVPQNPSAEVAPLQTQIAVAEMTPGPGATPTAPTGVLEPKDSLALQRDLIQNAADNRIKSWTLLAQAIGAAVLGIGGYFTWRNLRVAQEAQRITQEGQITNRFTQAIDQLGAEKKGKDGEEAEPNLEVRLGGIYALERIARDSSRDYWTIMQILTAYVRQNAARTDPSHPNVPPPDIQAILTVIQRRIPPRDREPEGHRLDLEDANLRGASALEGANLTKAYMMRANLEGAHLNGADLTEADLTDAILTDAILDAADLRTAIGLTEDQLKRAKSLTHARLPLNLAHLKPRAETQQAGEPSSPAPEPPASAEAPSLAETSTKEETG